MEKSPPLPAVYPDDFANWKNHLVKQHLFRDLENAFLDIVIDPLPTKSLDALTMAAIKREGYKQFLDVINEWIPIGVNIDDIDDSTQ